MKLICEELDNVEFVTEATKIGKNYFIKQMLNEMN